MSATTSNISNFMRAPGLVTALVGQTAAQKRSIIVASTTSTQDSGLFGYLLPIFKQKTGIDVKVVAQGTGQALDTARRGDADVVFVHAKAAEEKFLFEGFGVKRYPVMYNDFVLIGPQDDPAGLKGTDIVAALQTIKRKAALFVSRGDRSGTHIAEIGLWRDAGINIATEKGRWYREIGQGMGAALNMAAALNAYVLSDRGTWLAFRSRRPDRRRQAAVQSVWSDAGQSGEASVRQKRARPAVHRLADLAGGPERNRRLQDQRRAIVLSQCDGPERVGYWPRCSRLSL